MTEFVSAYTDDATNTVVSVSRAHAESSGLTILESDPPLDRLGRPRGPREGGRGKTAAKKTSVAKKATASKKVAKSAAKKTATTKKVAATTDGGSPASTPEEGSA